MSSDVACCGGINGFRKNLNNSQVSLPSSPPARSASLQRTLHLYPPVATSRVHIQNKVQMEVRGYMFHPAKAHIPEPTFSTWETRMCCPETSHIQTPYAAVHAEGTASGYAGETPSVTAHPTFKRQYRHPPAMHSLSSHITFPHQSTYRHALLPPHPLLSNFTANGTCYLVCTACLNFPLFEGLSKQASHPEQSRRCNRSSA